MKTKELVDGDLLFVMSQSDMAEAIQLATGRYSHVAIFFGGWIYHAVAEKGVIKQALADFLQLDEKYAIYAYLEMDKEVVHKKAEKYLGMPYNASFYPEQNAFYCSEYIAAILPIFATVPMQFSDGKQEISPFWKEYFDQLGLPVPLYKQGTNPNQLAQSSKLIYKGVLDD